MELEGAVESDIELMKANTDSRGDGPTTIVCANCSHTTHNAKRHLDAVANAAPAGASASRCRSMLLHLDADASRCKLASQHLTSRCTRRVASSALYKYVLSVGP